MFTSKNTLLFLTVIVICSLLLVACQPPGGPATSPPSESNKNITIVIAEDPPSFNPMVADTGYDVLVMELVMLGLTDVDPQGNVFPELAAELPTITSSDIPGLMIFISIISVNYIGDGLRDAFDPYKVLESVGEYT